MSVNHDRNVPWWEGATRCDGNSSIYCDSHGTNEEIKKAQNAARALRVKKTREMYSARGRGAIRQQRERQEQLEREQRRKRLLRNAYGLTDDRAARVMANGHYDGAMASQERAHMAANPGANPRFHHWPVGASTHFYNRYTGTMHTPLAPSAH